MAILKIALYCHRIINYASKVRPTGIFRLAFFKGENS
jgi:hypothetical protein